MDRGKMSGIPAQQGGDHDFSGNALVKHRIFITIICYYYRSGHYAGSFGQWEGHFVHDSVKSGYWNSQSGNWKDQSHYWKGQADIWKGFLVNEMADEKLPW